MWLMGETWAMSPPGTEKNDLFNRVREHLTLNLCETEPDRSTMENRGAETKSYGAEEGGLGERGGEVPAGRP